MDIHVVKGAWSILPFEWNDVPKFVVLTGLNGVGKTQLLQVINASISGTLSHNLGQVIPKVQITGADFQRDDVVLQSNWGSGLGVRGEDALKLTGELRELYNAAKQNRGNHVRVREIVESVLNKPIEVATFEEFVTALPDEYTLYSNRIAMGYASFSKAAALYRLKGSSKNLLRS